MTAAGSDPASAEDDADRTVGEILVSCGLQALDTGAPAEQVTAALFALRGALDGIDDVRREMIRSRAIDALKRAKITGATRLVDKALAVDRPAAKSTPRARAADTGEMHLTDTGNALRIQQICGDSLRYVVEAERFIYWADTHWEFDDKANSAAMRFGLHAVLRFHKEAIAERDEATRKKMIDHALRSEGRREREAAVALYKHLPGVAVRVGQLDQHPFLWNCPNGTLDLKTGELRRHRREDLITKLCPISYDPDAKCPLWTAAVAEWMSGDEELIEFLQRFFGYCMTGDSREQCIAIFDGDGANGKTTLIEQIRHVFGPYVANVDSSSILVQRDPSRPRNDLARLHNARLVTTSENEEEKTLDEGLIKSHCGGEPLSARFLFKEIFEFIPTFKLVLTTNHRPAIRGDDHGVWRRIRVVLFAVKYTESGDSQGRFKRDKGLKEKLIAESAGVLAWLVRGCLRWQEEGLGTAKKIDEAVIEFQEECDALAGFIADRCVLKADAVVSGSALYKAYVEWNGDAVGKKPLSNKQFAERMKTKSGVVKHRTDEFRGWKGIELRNMFSASSGDA